MIRSVCGIFVLCFATLLGTMAGPAEIDEMGVVVKSAEMMAQHPYYHSVNRELARRLLITFCDELDPLKVYLLKEDVAEWIHPSQHMEEMVIASFQEGSFTLFETMFLKMEEAIGRRHLLDQKVEAKALPQKVRVRVNEFDWADSVGALERRLMLIRSMQLEAIQNLDASLRESSLNRLKKQQDLFEQHRLPPDLVLFSRTLCTFIMKAFAEALDAQTAFYTPAEAKQLLVGMQQHLFGIGVLLRDDADGFSVVKIVEGGPAERQGGLMLGDKIIAVDNEPVIGLDVLEVVEMIRGQPGSEVELKVMRKDKNNGPLTPVHIPIRRGEVVVKESRYGSQVKPIDKGVLAYLRLHSFYQDAEDSSSSDLRNAVLELTQHNDVKGIVLDLRCNPGGLLTQAVAVAGLFLDKGVVVSIPDESGNVIHIRNLNGKKVWDGPLVVLMNRGSASAAEIVAQVLQDWGRAIIIGDDRSFGKGSFQVFTLCPDGKTPPNPQGEYKITRGRYYTVSGKSPQLVGVRSDIVVPGTLSFAEIGEEYLKFPLPADRIDAHFTDTMEDLPFFQRSLVRRMYASSEQKTMNRWIVYIPELKKRSTMRMNKNVSFQQFVNQLQSHATKEELPFFQRIPHRTEKNPSSHLALLFPKLKMRTEVGMRENVPFQRIENPIQTSMSEVDYQLEEAWKIMEDLTKLSEEKEVVSVGAS